MVRFFLLPLGLPGPRFAGVDAPRALPTSSCGRTLSPSAIGHTGFTGTSLWIDHERDLYIVLLTNRIHPSRANEQLRALRPRVHEAVVSAFDRHFR